MSTTKYNLVNLKSDSCLILNIFTICTHRTKFLNLLNVIHLFLTLYIMAVFKAVSMDG